LTAINAFQGEAGVASMPSIKNSPKVLEKVLANLRNRKRIAYKAQVAPWPYTTFN
jgi:hypothetical protein